MFEVKNLTKTYGNRTIIQDLNFTIKEGEIVGLLGLNGVGKSTTLNIITGYILPSQGEVLFEGTSMEQNNLEIQKNIGYLPEIPPLYQDFTPMEHLEFVCAARKISKSKIPMEVDRVCTLANIKHVSKKLIRHLSKGYKQRVGIAAALVGNPKIIVLDEPTVGLDPMQWFEVRKLLIDLSKEHIIIISSHILGELFSICTRFLMITNKGQLADMTKDEFLAQCMDYNSINIQLQDTQKDYTSFFLEQPFISNCMRNADLPNNIADYQILLNQPNKPSSDLFNLLSKHNMPTFAITPAQKTLEEIFIELTSTQAKS